MEGPIFGRTDPHAQGGMVRFGALSVRFPYTETLNYSKWLTTWREVQDLTPQSGVGSL